jgi:F-type H+-transporting ATPase subunit beta
MAENKDQEKIGHVVEVIGPVVDILFQEHHLPFIHNAVRITSEGFNVPEPLDIVAEVAQQLGEGRVRCVAMKPTEGLVRGMKAENLGEPISVPVGRIRVTGRHRRWRISPLRLRCLRRASKLWT